MCGISGMLRFDQRPVEQSILETMCRVQHHRGPDDQGVYVDGPLGLGHNRLSIIDLSPQGHQPMSNSAGTLWITYNGEIYNFQDVRRELEALGHTFRSQSDTEVIIQAYETWGLSCLDRFAGMFAFAIWDCKKRQLILVRDRYGVKPLFYYKSDQCLIFASEIKTILAGGVKPQLQRDQVHEFLMYNWLIGESTLFEGVKSLMPGHHMTVKLDRAEEKLEQEPYYTVFDQVQEDIFRRIDRTKPDQICDELDDLLQESIRLRLVSDVPVGSLCSGGVDSSLVTALACRISPDVSVFNVNVTDGPDASLSEGVFAQKVADHLGVSMHRFDLDRTRFLEMFAPAVYHNDLPLTHPNAVPLYYISRMAAENGVKVLLSGEGADELFGGYTWRYTRLFNYYRRKKLARFFPNRFKFFFGDTFLLDDHIMMYGYKTALNNVANVLDFVSARFERSGLRAAGRQAYAFEKRSHHREVLAFLAADMREYLEHILHRQDRSTMQASVECREPLLSHRLVQYAVNIPLRYKLRRGEGKWILKKLACRYLPRDLVYRKKVGFGLPLQYYLPYPGGAIFKDGFWANCFDLPWAKIEPLFRNTKDILLWYSFLNFEVWGRIFLNNEKPEEITEKYFQ